MRGRLKVVRLKLIGGADFEIRDDVPITRAECPKRRPCGHVRCRYHLWFVDGRDRAGRSGAGRETRSGFGVRPLGSTLRPGWLEWPSPPSCALDEAERIASSGARCSYPRLAALVDLRDGDWALEIVRRATGKLAVAIGEPTTP